MSHPCKRPRSGARSQGRWPLRRWEERSPMGNAPPLALPCGLGGRDASGHGCVREHGHDVSGGRGLPALTRHRESPRTPGRSAPRRSTSGSDRICRGGRGSAAANDGHRRPPDTRSQRNAQFQRPLRCSGLWSPRPASWKNAGQSGVVGSSSLAPVAPTLAGRSSRFSPRSTHAACRSRSSYSSRASRAAARRGGASTPGFSQARAPAASRPRQAARWRTRSAAPSHASSGFPPRA